MKKNGFTLIEILIVVAIIGLLATMGLIAFQTSLRRTRDARRISELRAIQGAAEQFYADQNPNAYPVGNNCALIQAYTAGFDNGFVDPRGAAYTCSFTGTTYCLCTDLEDNADGNSNTNACNMGGGVGFECLQNLF